MSCTQNNREFLHHFFVVCVECFRVFMACMLTLFVPQDCGGKLCDMTDHLEKRTVYFYINIFSLFTFILMYIFETQRQCFLIKNFDIDNTFPDDNLKNVLSKDDYIYKYLKKINKCFGNYILFLIIIYIINVITSMYYIITYRYYGMKTLTGFATNILLISTKIGNEIYVMYMCRTTDLSGLSTTLQEPVSYNVLEQIDSSTTCTSL